MVRKRSFICGFIVVCLSLPLGQHVFAGGGCGSICLPLEVLDPEKTQLRKHQFRFSNSLGYAEFDNFREGGSSVTNPGGNEATITQAAFFIDYGVTEKFTISILFPYVHKKQNTNRFGTRIAAGIGDVAFFGRYEVISNFEAATSVALGLGIKFPSGSIDEPNSTQLLPPVLQAGSGAYDLVPTISFFRDFRAFTLFGDAFVRIPLDENKRGYKFGREYHLSAGLNYPFPLGGGRFSILLSFNYLYAKHDKDSKGVLPGRLLDGTKVLNTGGQFFDIVPGFRCSLIQNLAMQARFAIPVSEDWNGKRALNVGQVAPDLTTQINLIYSFNK